MQLRLFRSFWGRRFASVLSLFFIYLFFIMASSPTSQKALASSSFETPPRVDGRYGSQVPTSASPLSASSAPSSTSETPTKASSLAKFRVAAQAVKASVRFETRPSQGTPTMFRTVRNVRKFTSSLRKMVLRSSPRGTRKKTSAIRMPVGIARALAKSYVEKIKRLGELALSSRSRRAWKARR